MVKGRMIDINVIEIDIEVVGERNRLIDGGNMK